MPLRVRHGIHERQFQCVAGRTSGPTIPAGDHTYLLGVVTPRTAAAAHGRPARRAVRPALRPHPDQPEPAWCAGDPPDRRAGYRIANKWRLWVDAGKARCVEHGGDQYALTRPGPVVRR
ncbi:MAG: hypothetical protein AVDCRST_MAG75-1545 [uncultured Propionibacteriaceae bacterium]|uniref:Uncharacterized protein n=1 Tax=uncultured Propionibacteriaceae bacterium TaxID=257457 RepID=A0A6J4NKB9_9ACTN|nr:MAG: hypothetical protein AVDCRST_MAG75-1545 [uncultured Propionibacteriaceae bacterium]